MDPPRDTTGSARRGLLAHAVVRLPVEEVAAMRRAPLAWCGEPFPASSLKHFDEQALAALAALQSAIRDSGLWPDPAARPFRDWGVLASPRFLGRASMVPSMARFHTEGAWGVSPHMIPYRSLHSVSGTASQFLQAHGPNFGVGGGHGGVGELLLAGLALLGSMRLPGLWLLASRIQGDRGVGENGHPPAGASCEAIALALSPRAGDTALALDQEAAAAFDFDSLARWLGAASRRPPAAQRGGRP